MNTVKPMYEWSDIPWRQLEKSVYKLQKRIFKASRLGDVKLVRRLQKLLIKSRAARLLTVRRVTQDNQGCKTAGVDGVKSLTPKQRLALTNKLKLSSKVAPTRRVWIPKPGKEEKRPLGIPTMYDRALQGLVKLVLEPTLYERPTLRTQWRLPPGNGRLVSSKTATVFALDVHVMMQ